MIRRLLFFVNVINVALNINLFHELDCSATAPDNGFVDGAATSTATHTNTVTYTCNAGYTLSSGGTLTCTSGSLGAAPTCDGSKYQYKYNIIEFSDFV